MKVEWDGKGNTAQLDFESIKHNDMTNEKHYEREEIALLYAHRTNIFNFQRRSRYVSFAFCADHSRDMTAAYLHFTMKFLFRVVSDY